MKLSGALRSLLAQMKLELDQLALRLEEADTLVQQTAQDSEACRRLTRFPASGRGQPLHGSRRSGREPPFAKAGNSHPGLV